jgi:hypothetical protein
VLHKGQYTQHNVQFHASTVGLFLHADESNLGVEIEDAQTNLLWCQTSRPETCTSRSVCIHNAKRCFQQYLDQQVAN